MAVTILARLFRHVSVPGDAEADLRALAARGSVVFVMRTAGRLNRDYIRWLALRARIPAVRAVLGLPAFLGVGAGDLDPDAMLRGALRERGSGLIFLRRSRTFRVRGVTARDPFPALAALQKELSHPVFLVPVLLVWSRRAQHLKPSVFDILFGSSEAPGTLATVVGFLRGHRRAFVRVGKPIDLAAFVAERGREGAPAIGRKVRGVLHYHLGREIRAALGPPFKDAARVREEVMRDRGLQETIAEVAREGGLSLAAVTGDAERHVRAIAARMSPAFFQLLLPIGRWMFDRLYDGIEVDETGFDELRRAAARAPVVLCPGHKSHMDYVVLTYLFYVRGLLPPHVAAGDNLAFWPFGAFARRCGGFFIRRSFKGDRLYAAALRAYVKRLLRDGFPQEFFIEGSRSRTGKLLAPKTGLLSMEVDAWLEGASEDVLFVPVAIDYEHLAEAQSHVRELGGAEKRKEGLRALVGARKVLRSRHGRIYIQFGRPISLRELGGPAKDSAQDGRRRYVQQLAGRIAFGISRAATVTPVGLLAAALLADAPARVAARTAADRIDLLRQLASEDGARFSAALAGAPSDPAAPGPIAAAAALLCAGGLVTGEGAGEDLVYVVADDRRSELDFYRNNVIHRFVAPALVAAAVRAHPGDRPASDRASETRGRTRWLSRLFKLEFTYRVGASFDAIYDETHASMAALGLLDDERRLEFVAAFISPYLEAYRTAVAVAAEWTGGDQRNLLRVALERARADHAAGRIRQAEAVSKATLENALAWLVEEGAFESHGEGGLEPGESWRAGAARTLLTEIEVYLRRDGAAPPTSPGAS